VIRERGSSAGLRSNEALTMSRQPHLRRVHATVGIHAGDAPEGGGRWGGEGHGRGRGSGVLRACARQPIASGQNSGSCTGHPDRFSRHPIDSCATKRHQMSPRGPSATRAPTAPARVDRAQAITFALRPIRIAPIEPELGPLSVADDRNFRKDAMGTQIRSRPVGLGALIGEDHRDGPWPQRFVNHCPLTLCPAGPCDRRNPCPQGSARAGGGAGMGARPGRRRERRGVSAPPSPAPAQHAIPAATIDGDWAHRWPRSPAEVGHDTVPTHRSGALRPSCWRFEPGQNHDPGSANEQPPLPD
jgi:hypothetical protein